MSKILFSQADVLALLPHRPPFLFVDHITRFKAEQYIRSEHYISPDADYFKGHFPNHPIVPGVLITEAMAQTAGLLWGFSKKQKEKKSDSGEAPFLFYLAASDIKYTAPVVPDVTLILSAYMEAKRKNLYIYSVDAYVKRLAVAKGTITLANRGALI